MTVVVLGALCSLSKPEAPLNESSYQGIRVNINHQLIWVFQLLIIDILLLLPSSLARFYFSRINLIYYVLTKKTHLQERLLETKFRT